MTPEAAAVRGGSTSPVVMWEQDPYPEDSVVQYNFTKWVRPLAAGIERTEDENRGLNQSASVSRFPSQARCFR